MNQDEKPTYFDVEGKTLRITHMSKVLFPEDGLTKAELLHYYMSVAPVLLPHIRGRPLTIKAFPHGIKGRPYYRRHLSKAAPAWLPRVEVEDGQTPVIEDTADLLWVVNQDSVELHPWLSRSQDLEHPDLLLFDLDPGAEVSFEGVCEAASLVNEALVELGVRCFPKTSGSKGIHILVGIEPRYGFKEVHRWVTAVARILTEYHPDVFTTSYARDKRVRKVLLDHNQVGYGRTTVSVYSVRPLAHAPVSTPLTWEEVETGRVSPDQFTIESLPARIEKMGDVMSELTSSRVELPHLP